VIRNTQFTPVWSSLVEFGRVYSSLVQFFEPVP
jgi:hypothetical protein